LPALIGVGPVKTPVREGVTSNVGQSRRSAVTAGSAASVVAGDSVADRAARGWPPEPPPQPARTTAMSRQ
jgi:hypothetical protein